MVAYCQVGDVHEYYTPMLVLIVTSIILQVTDFEGETSMAILGSQR